MRGQLAYIRFIQAGRPGQRPDQGFNPDYPDQGLPGGEGGDEYPDQGLPGRPPYPSQGLPPSFGGGHPGHLPARPPWSPGIWPPGPTDPEWGVDGDLTPTPPMYLPIGPDQGLPPVAGHLPANPDPPPGTIWPPLPPSAPAGKAALLVWLIGVGWRYFVVTIPVAPDQGLPGGSGGAQPKR